MGADEWTEGSDPPRTPLGRRLFHLVAGSVFPTLRLVLPKAPVLIAVIVLTVAAIGGEALRRRRRGLNESLLRVVRPLIKEGERQTVFASTLMLASTTIVIGTMDKEVAVLALYYLSLGDASAAIVGERLGRHRLIGRRSIEGSGAMVAACLIIGVLLLETGLETTYPVVIVGACAAMLAELVDIKVDDNVTIPILSGVAMTVTAQAWG